MLATAPKGVLQARLKPLGRVASPEYILESLKRVLQLVKSYSSTYEGVLLVPRNVFYLNTLIFRSLHVLTT
jgi:hypothetical protein